MKTLLLHNSATAGHFSVKLLLALSSFFGFKYSLLTSLMHTFEAHNQWFVMSTYYRPLN